MKISIKIFIFLFFLFVFISKLKAQLVLKQKYEIEIKNNDDDKFEVFTLGEEGVLLFKIKEQSNYKKTKEFIFEKLDTNLVSKQTFNTSLPYHFTQNYQIYLEKNENLHLLSKPEYGKKIVLYRFNITQFSGELFELEMPNRVEITTFKAIKDDIYLVGEANGEEVVVNYNFLSKTQKILPNFFDKNDELNDFQPNFENQQMIFGLSDERSRKCNFALKGYSALIGEQKRINLKTPERETTKKTLKNWRIYPLSTTELWVFGTYSHNCIQDVSGVFAIKIENQEQKKAFYKPFFDFFNIYKHLSKRRAAKLEAKREKARDKKQEKNLIKKVLPHQKLYKIGNQIVWILENYYTQNNNTTLNNSRLVNPYFYYNQMPRWQSPINVTQNYVHTHATLCAWNEKGEFLWDNMINIEESNQKQLEETISIAQLGDSLVLAYIFNEKIYTKLIHQRRTIKEETEQKLDDIFKTQYNISTHRNYALKTWYNQSFLFIDEIDIYTEGKKKNIFVLQKMNYQKLPPTEKELKKKLKIKN
jgi:tRNA threonylcarbamoyladenosine modification (KEOPS) complex Cgi121 subunit